MFVSLLLSGRPEFQNPKPELFLQTEQGVVMPLSLVRIVEDFEVEPCFDEGEDLLIGTLDMSHCYFPFTDEDDEGERWRCLRLPAAKR